MNPGSERIGDRDGAEGPTGRDAERQAPPMVDELQDELMSIHSSDGRPPPRRLRVAEWRWVVILVPIVLLCIAGWAVSRQLDVGTILGGLVLVVALVAAGAPVWGAGLMRGSEEREARREAMEARGAAPGAKKPS